MEDGARANPKEFRKKGLVRLLSWKMAVEQTGISFPRATSLWNATRSIPGIRKLFTITILAGSVLPMVHGSLLNLKSMVETITGRSAILSFVGYGCYCGLGGRGLPMDEVDWCCHAHDCCYQKLFDQGCRPYVDGYKFSIDNETQTITCSEQNETECDKQTCECDKNVVLCLNNQLYNEEYRSYFNIFCTGNTPSCSIYDPLPVEIESQDLKKDLKRPASSASCFQPDEKCEPSRSGGIRTSLSSKIGPRREASFKYPIIPLKKKPRIGISQDSSSMTEASKK